MCVHYSTLGKKVDHKLLKEDGPANNLLLIYLVYHKNRGTALLLRENLKAFSTEYLEGLAKEAGYQHLASIIVEASDAGLSVNPRCRRYDVFILPEMWNVHGNPADAYNSMKQHIKDQIEPVHLSGVIWVTQEHDLRMEMQDSYNRNCELPLDKVASISLQDWTALLSQEERENYSGYLKRLDMADKEVQDRELCVVAVQQDPVAFPMQSRGGTLPAFTTDSTKRLMVTNRDRWMLAKEKLACFGFPVCKEFADVAKTPVLDIGPNEGWHRCVGNGMVIPNAGMVISCVLSCISPTAKLMGLICSYRGAHELQGLPPVIKYHSGWKCWRVEVGGTLHRMKDKEVPLQ
ncbi:unnamed protein product [Durusdinium trenchii]|uniref:Uncharacterized protein n=1 Tax=Durusdinium trenchii TaxID=1381693 RepID=A0ABP0KUG8_9DINO